MRKTMVAVALFTLAGCGEGSSKVTVHTGSVLVVAIDPRADGSWIRLPPMTDVTMDMGPRWMAASICGGGSYVEVWVDAYRRGDDDDVELPCRGDGTTPVEVPVTVAGSTRAEVSIGRGGAYIENGSGTVFASPGTWDLLAVDESDPLASAVHPMVIQRGVTVAAGTPIAIDLLGGFRAEARPVTAHGALGPISGQGYLELSGDGGTFAVVPRPYPAPTDAVMLPPADRLIAADKVVVDLYAYDQAGAGQSVSKTVGADPIEVTMPPALEGASVALDGGRPTATWKKAGGWDTAELSAFYSDLSDPQNRHMLRWGFSDPDAAGDDHLEFPDLTRILAWDPAWNLPATGDVSVDVSLFRREDDGWVRTSWGRSLAPP